MTQNMHMYPCLIQQGYVYMFLVTVVASYGRSMFNDNVFILYAAWTQKKLTISHSAVLQVQQTVTHCEKSGSFRDSVAPLCSDFA